MATQKTTVEVDVTDKGSTAKIAESAKKLHQTLKDMIKTAGATVSGGAQRALSYAKSGTTYAPTMSERQYGIARGTAGTTRASARDFAKQSEGLSGLVRLYATYAANLYAAGAAYEALSRAMDTANMVKGLNQIGAASGTALGTLSRRLVEATDGAVSLREAMEATVKASSSGMSSEQIIRMGKAAQAASQALGIDMSDALSRITRGITKLEPELLDELGIFIKVGDVATQYAQKVGKSATAITDFEKRQAVANAVLAQAEQKFSAINIDTNPYTKLAATMHNLTQAGLELANKVLAPIANYLSQSPTALSIGMSAFIGLIVKQALPALAMYRESLIANTEASVKASASKYATAKKYLNLELGEMKAAADVAAEQAHDRFERASGDLINIHQAAQGKIRGISKEVVSIAAMNATDITPQQLATIDKYAQKSSNIAPIYKNLAESIRRYQAEHAKAMEGIAAAEQDNIARREALNKRFVSANKSNLQDMYASNMRAQAAEITSTHGLIAAIKNATASYSKLRSGVAEVSLEMDTVDAAGKKVTSTITEVLPATSRLGAGMAVLGSVAAATASKVAGIISSLGGVLQLIGIVVTAGGLLYSWLSNTSKQSKEASSAIDLVETSLDNVSKTFSNIASKPAHLKFDTSSISAASTAVADLADQLQNAFIKSYAEISAMNFADKLVDIVMPGSVEGRLTKNISKGLVEAFNNIDRSSSVAKSAEEAIGNILQLDIKAPLTVDIVDRSLAKMTSSERKNAIESITSAFKAMSKEMQISAARGVELQTTFSELSNAKQKLQVSLIPKDEFSAYGQKLVEASAKLSAALQDPVQKYNAILLLAKEYVSVGSNPAVAIQLKEIASDVAVLNNLSIRYAKSQEDLANTEQKLNTLVGKSRTEAIMSGKKVLLSGLTDAGQAAVRELVSDIKALRKEASTSIGLQVEVTTKIKDAKDTIAAAQLDIFKAGAALVSSAIGAEWEKANSTIKNAYASILSGTETGVRLRAESERSVIKAQMAQIESQRNLIISNQELALALERNVLEEQKKNADQLDRGLVIPDKEAKLNLRERELQLVKEGKSVKGIYANLTKELIEGKKNLTAIDITSLDFARNLESSAAAIANLRAQLTTIDINAADQLIVAQFDTRQKVLKAQADILKADRESLVITKDQVGTSSLAFTIDRQRLDTREQELSQSSALLAIEATIARYKKTGAVGVAELAKVQAQKESLVLQQGIEATTLRIAQTQERSAVVIKAETDERQRQKDIFDAETAATEMQISASLALLEVGKQSGALTETEFANQKYLLDVQKSRLSTSKEIADINKASADKLGELAQREGGIRAAEAERKLTQAETATLALIAQQRQIILDRQNSSVTSANLLLDSNLQNLAVSNSLVTSFDIILEKITSLKDIMSGFGEGFGAQIVKGAGDTATAMAEMGRQLESNSKMYYHYGKVAEEAFNKSMNAATPEEALKHSEVMSDALSKQNTLVKKNQKDELAGYSKTFGAAKTMFKEKTAAYKAFSALERTTQMLSIALELKTAAVKIATWMGLPAAKATSEAALTGAEAAGFMARSATYIAEIYAKYSAMLGPWGMAAAAIAVSSIFGTGGSKSSALSVPTSEQLQETQGTGTTWVRDQQTKELVKSETGGGVFGSTSAKSQSILNAIEIIKANSIAGLDYDNRMLRAMEKVANALTGAASALYTVPGLRQGATGFGTLSGKVSKEAAGISGALSNIPVIGTLLGGIFGGKTDVTTSIESAGIAIKGTFADLLDTATANIVQYKDVLLQFEKDGGWFGSNKSWTERRRETESLNAYVTSAISDVYKNAKDMFTVVGSLSGVTASTVESTFKNMSAQVDIDLKGLTGEEVLSELNAVIGSQLDTLASKLFAAFDKYRKFGEGFLETVIRVVDGNTKVSKALEYLGSKFNLLTTTADKFDISEKLIKAAGSLENFVDQATYFSDNFLEDSERLAIQQKALDSQLTKLGVSTKLTKAEFKNLVQGLDLSTEGGASLYQSLMDLAPSFIAVSDLLDNSISDSVSKLESLVTSFRDFAKQIREFKQSLILGNLSTATPQQKLLEAASAFETTYSDALAGDTAAMGKLTSSSQAYLEAARTYYASSAEYTSIFESVLSKLDTAESKALTTADTADLQLSQLKSHTILLANIDAGIAKLAGITSVPTQAAATGGWRQGITLVGEKGPEVVDFTNPGRVYTADQTAGMFTAPSNQIATQQAIVRELVAVRQELAQLRKDQQQQTGDLIVSQYDASQKASAEVADAVASSSREAAWATKSKPELR
jgi:hypothetical protein